MVEIYVTLIISKRRTFGSVPNTFKEAVKTRLKEQGYDTNGDRIVTEE